MADDTTGCDSNDPSRWQVRHREPTEAGFMQPVHIEKGQTFVTNAPLGMGKSVASQQFFRPKINSTQQKHVVFAFTSRTVQTYDECSRFKEAYERVPSFFVRPDLRPVANVLTKYDMLALARGAKEQFSFEDTIARFGEAGGVIALTGETLGRMQTKKLVEYMKENEIEYSLCMDEVHLFTEKYASETTQKDWHRGEQNLAELYKNAAYVFAASADIGIEDFDVCKATRGSHKTLPEDMDPQAWVDAVEKGGSVRTMLEGLGGRVCVVDTYTSGRISKRIRVEDDICLSHQLLQADAGTGHRLHVVSSGKKEIHELTEAAERMGKRVFKKVGGDGSNDKETNRAFRNIDAFLEDKDIWAHNNSVSVGVDPTAQFAKQIGITKSGMNVGSLEEFFQGLFRVGRHGNLSDEVVSVRLDDKEPLVDQKNNHNGPWLQRPGASLEGSEISVRRHRQTVTEQAASLRASGVDVGLPVKLNVLPPYARRMVAWSKWNTVQSWGNHASTFVRHAIFHHCRLEDARVFNTGGADDDGEDGDDGDDGGDEPPGDAILDVVPDHRRDDHHLSEEPSFYAALFVLALNVDLVQRQQADQDQPPRSGGSDDDDDGDSVSLSFNAIDTYTDWVEAILPAPDTEAWTKQQAAVDTVMWPLLLESVQAKEGIDDDKTAENLRKKMRELEEARAHLGTLVGAASGDNMVMLALLQRDPPTRPVLTPVLLANNELKEPAVTSTAADLLCRFGQAFKKIRDEVRTSRMVEALSRYCTPIFVQLDSDGWNYRKVLGFDNSTRSQNSEYNTMVLSIFSTSRRYHRCPPYKLYKALKHAGTTLEQTIRLRAAMVAFPNPVALMSYEASKFDHAAAYFANQAASSFGGEDDVDTDEDDDAAQTCCYAGSAAVDAVNAVNLVTEVSTFRRALCTDLLGVDPMDGGEITDEGVIEVLSTKLNVLDESNNRTYAALVKVAQKLSLAKNTHRMAKDNGKYSGFSYVQELLKVGCLRLKKYTKKQEKVYTVVKIDDIASPLCTLAGLYRMQCPVEPNITQWMSATDMRKNLTGGDAPSSSITNTGSSSASSFLSASDFEQACAYVDGLRADDPEVYSLWQSDGVPRSNVIRHEFVTCADVDPILAKLNVVESFGSVRVCKVVYYRKNGRLYLDKHEMGGATKSLQTVNGTTVRPHIAGPLYIGELDQVNGHPTIAACLMRNFFSDVDISGLERYNEDPQHWRQRVREAFELGEGADANALAKSLFHTINFGGEVHNWIERAPCIVIQRLLRGVSKDQARLIWQEFKPQAAGAEVVTIDRAKDYLEKAARQQRGRPLKGERGAKQLLPASLVGAVSNARIIHSQLDVCHRNLRRDHRDLHRILSDFETATLTAKEQLLEQFPQYVRACLVDPEKGTTGKNWKSKPHKPGMRMDENTAYHNLLCHYEVPALLWMVDFMGSRGFQLDPLIHDGSLVRRSELPVSAEAAATNAVTDVPRSVIDECEAHIAAQSLRHLGVAISIKLDMKPLLGWMMPPPPPPPPPPAATLAKSDSEGDTAALPPPPSPTPPVGGGGGVDAATAGALAEAAASDSASYAPGFAPPPRRVVAGGAAKPPPHPGFIEGETQESMRAYTHGHGAGTKRKGDDDDDRHQQKLAATKQLAKEAETSKKTRRTVLGKHGRDIAASLASAGGGGGAQEK